VVAAVAVVAAIAGKLLPLIAWSKARLTPGLFYCLTGAPIPSPQWTLQGLCV